MKETEVMATEIDYDNRSTVPLQQMPDENVQAHPLIRSQPDIGPPDIGPPESSLKTMPGGRAPDAAEGNPYLKILAGTIIGLFIVAGPLYLLGKTLPVRDDADKGSAPVASANSVPLPAPNDEAMADDIASDTSSTWREEAIKRRQNQRQNQWQNQWQDWRQNRADSRYPIGDRPVEAIARDLGVTPEQFRAAFAKVTPAPRGTTPTKAQKDYNRNVLLRELNVSPEKLNEVMDKYRPEGPRH